MMTAPSRKEARIVEVEIPNGRTISFTVTPHFYDQIRTRDLLDYELNDSGLTQLILDSIVITSRPTNLNALLMNGCRSAIYLYIKGRNMVLVLEEHSQSKECTVVKTAYSADTSKWVQEWLSANPRHTRIRFKDAFATSPLTST